MADVSSGVNHALPVSPSPVGQKTDSGSPEPVGPAQRYDVFREIGDKLEPREAKLVKLSLLELADSEEFDIERVKLPPKKILWLDPDPAGCIARTDPSRPPKGNGDQFWFVYDQVATEPAYPSEELDPIGSVKLPPTNSVLVVSSQ